MRELTEDGAYMRGCEVQDGKRGGDGRMALHDHLIVRTKSPLVEKDVRRLAVDAGFGHSVKVVPVEPGSRREAYYVSKYVVKSSDQRRAVPWVADVVDGATGEVVTEDVAVARYRTWSSSRAWGSTMMQLRQAARERWLLIEQERDLAAEQAAGIALWAAGLLSDQTSPSPPP